MTAKRGAPVAGAPLLTPQPDIEEQVTMALMGVYEHVEFRVVITDNTARRAISGNRDTRRAVFLLRRQAAMRPDRKIDRE